MTGDWVHGVHGIRGMLDAGITGVLLVEKGQDRARALIRASGTGVSVEQVTRAELRKRTDNVGARIAAFRAGSETQAVRVAGSTRSSNRVDRPNRVIDLAALKPVTSRETIFALDQVTDPHNLGAIIRTANRFGVRAVVYPKRGSATDSEVVRRASAGTSEHQLHGTVVNLARTLRDLRDAGYWIYAAEARGEALPDAVISFPAVIVFGSEGEGIRPNVRENCDAALAIPGGGFADSLNVSVAAGIFAYELNRQLRHAP
ncbi:MAG: RNA methyltransferase [Spirochaetaceae bacterium]|nr:MAG: RNA methyltransferase [Spirochaetaceae bacterium]